MWGLCCRFGKPPLLTDNIQLCLWREKGEESNGGNSKSKQRRGWNRVRGRNWRVGDSLHGKIYQIRSTISGRGSEKKEVRRYVGEARERLVEWYECLIAMRGWGSGRSRVWVREGWKTTRQVFLHLREKVSHREKWFLPIHIIVFFFFWSKI